MLVDKILNIITMSCQPTCRVRLVTLELSLKLLLQLVLYEGKNKLSEIHKAAMDGARAQSTALVRNFYKSEEIFLDMFEHEYDLFQLRFATVYGSKCLVVVHIHTLFFVLFISCSSSFLLLFFFLLVGCCKFICMYVYTVIEKENVNECSRKY